MSHDDPTDVIEVLIPALPDDWYDFDVIKFHSDGTPYVATL